MLLIGGDLEQAAIRYREAIRIDPDYAKAHHNLALVLVRQGDLEQAAEHLEEAIRIDPGYASAHRNLGKVRERLGDAAATSAAPAR